MIAFDTNMLVRLFVDDNPPQTDIAENLLKIHRVFISRTVILETEWVLRSCYKFPKSAIHACFYLLLQAENVEIENIDIVTRAVGWYAQGADFADALHLACCGEAVMHTFDKNFCKVVSEVGISKVQIWEV